jgi:uncharacterized protein (TIGR02453 family)
VTTSSFTGFGAEALGFYAGLEADNSKAYWTDHRERYERAVREPMLALLADLEPEFGPARLFRPYRDVRFSADKSPYKTHQGAVVAHPGGAGAWYVRVAATGIAVGGGVMNLDADRLAAYRAAVDADRSGRALAAIVTTLTGAGFETVGDTLIRAPRGFDPTHPRIDLLRHKTIALVLDHGDPDWFTTPTCRDEVAAVWREIDPFLAWFGKHVGPDPDDDPARARPRPRPRSGPRDAAGTAVGDPRARPSRKASHE